LVVTTPTLLFNQTSNGATYSSYNVYVGTEEGSETLQNNSPITLGTNWTEPTSGITTTGRAVPITSTIQPMGGYIIGFRYYKARPQLSQPSDSLSIPDVYIDVLVNGVSAFAWKFLEKEKQAAASMELFKDGLTSMIWDKNLFPNTDFIRPDPASFVNNQILGILPAEF